MRPCLPDRAEHCAAQHRHHHARRQHKAVAHRDPLPRWGQPAPGDQTVQVRGQHQSLTPGVQCRDDPRLSTAILRGCQQGAEGLPRRLKQPGSHHRDIGEPQRLEVMGQGGESHGHDRRPRAERVGG